MKRHYIFASHGTFANGLLNSVELILGKQPDIHTLCAYVEEEVDLTQQVEALLARFPAQDELIVGNDSNLLIVFYVQIMPDDLVMQLHRF